MNTLMFHMRNSYNKVTLYNIIEYRFIQHIYKDGEGSSDMALLLRSVYSEFVTQTNYAEV